MKRLLPILGLLAACATSGGEFDGVWVDLSHDFSSETLYWPTAPRFELSAEAKGETADGYWYEANRFSSAEHGGTHIDAPIHFAEGRQSVDQIPVSQLVGPGCVVDVSDAALADPDYQVTTADLKTWEDAHGAFPRGAIVLLRTGYGRFWPDAKRYMGTDARGPEAVPDLHFPGLHPDAARWLVAERRIDAIGIDTPSIDFGQSELFETHRSLFAHGLPAFENVANLDRLPPRGAHIIALPMKIKGGSGGPLRIVARLPR